MDNDNIMDELIALIAKVQNEMEEHKSKSVKPYLDVFKEYDDTLDFDKYGFETQITKYGAYVSYEILSKVNNNVTVWNSDKIIARVYVANNTNEVSSIDVNTRDSIDFSKGKDFVDYYIYAREIGAKLTRICYEHKDTIGHKLNRINAGDEMSYFTEKITAVNHMINFMKDITKHKLTDKIWNEGGVNYKDYGVDYNTGVLNPGSGGSTVYINELQFSRNNSGTYTVILKNNGNTVATSTRCSQYNLENIIETITRNMNDWDKELFKNL